MKDYEKAYKEALERARESLKDGGISQNSIDYIQSIFPELKESEGERIRKNILDCIQYMKDNYCIPSRYTSKQYDTWIAWLEKQGEHKSINDTDEEIVNAVKDTSVLDLVEPKSAWSEEDEKIVLSVEQVMNCASLLNIVPEKVDKIRTWLKSLKDRVQSQWKPSDEQIQALQYQVYSTYKGSWQYKASKELLEQLKKL